MQYSKADLTARLGEPAEEFTKPNTQRPGTMIHVLRWECGCGAARTDDELLWEWDGSDCPRHGKGLRETIDTVKTPDADLEA